MRRTAASVEQRYTRRLFGRELERLLVAKRDKMSQNAIAVKVGRSPATLTGWKQGRTLPEEDGDYRRLARVLGGNYDELVHRAQLDDLDYTIRKWGIEYEDAVFMIGELKTWDETTPEDIRRIRAALAVRVDEPSGKMWRALRRHGDRLGVSSEEYAAVFREETPDFLPPDEEEDG